MTKFYDPAQVRLAQLEGEIQRVTKFGTWEGWSPEDTNYLLGELRNRLAEDCPFPSHDELVAIALEARQSALGGTPSEEEVLRSLLRFALTVEGIIKRPSVADEVIALLDGHLVKRGFPSVGHVPRDQ